MLVLFGWMVIGPSDPVRCFTPAEGEGVSRIVKPRLRREVEEAGGGRRESGEGLADRCPPAVDVCPPRGPVAFDRYLEKRNREDGVEFSAHLRRTAGGVGTGVKEKCPAEEGRKVKGSGGAAGAAAAEGAERGGRARGPRLGDVSPVVAEAVRRKVETVYRVQIPLNPGARVDVVG